MRLVDGFSLSQRRKDAGVVRLCPPAEYPGCRDLEAYWEALRGDNIVPKRTDFDPRGIERSLTHTFVAERVAPSVVRLRVAGTQLSDLLGMDVRGMPITAFFNTDSREVLNDVCRRLFDGPEKITLDLTSPSRMGRAALVARLILLPMSDGHGRITRVVGSLEATGSAGRTPRRFSISHVHATALEGRAPARVKVATSYPLPQTRHPAPEFADIEQASFRSRRERTRSGTDETSIPHAPRTHLRLVVDNA